MKVLQINCNGYYGSTGKIVRKLSDDLTERGVENYIICSGYKEQKIDDKTFFVSGYKTVKFNQIMSRIFGDAGFHFNFTTRKVIKLIERIRPDVVHLHHLESFFINTVYLLKYLKKNNIPTVWTMHDCWPITGHCTHFFSVNCDKWVNGCHHCPQIKQFPYSLVFDRSKRLYALKKAAVTDWKDLHIANVSYWMQNNIKRSFMQKKEMRVVYNGINLSAFYPSADREKTKALLGASGKFVIISVASTWGEKKGFDNFKELSGVLAEDEVIVLVGLSENQKKELPEKIIGLGRTKSVDELRELYSMADVYVNLSLEETFGLVSVEAMACGTPVIACNTTANPEIATAECGVIIENRDVAGITSAIKKVKSRGKAFYSGKCIDRVVNNFSDLKMCEGYYEYYLDVTENGRK